MRKQTWRRRDSAWESDEQKVSYEQMMSLDLAILLVTVFGWLSDPFEGCLWPPTFGDKKVTLNHLGKCFFGVCDVICTYSVFCWSGIWNYHFCWRNPVVSPPTLVFLIRSFVGCVFFSFGAQIEMQSLVGPLCLVYLVWNVVRKTNGFRI